MLKIGTVFVEVFCRGHFHREVLLTGIVADGNNAADGTLAVLAHGGTADAATNAGGHFHKAAGDPAGDYVLQGGNAVFTAVNGKVGVVLRVAEHGFKYAAGGGKVSCSGFGKAVHAGLGSDVFSF